MTETIAKTEKPMKQYLLTIYQPDGPPPPPDFLGPVMADVDAFIQETKDAGVWVFNGGLHPPSTATVVRLQDPSHRGAHADGGLLMTDGPFVEGKEHVGGFIVVKAPDLDGALAWAAKLARVLPLPIEVRPFQEEA
jgi:hypothetical protein